MKLVASTSTQLVIVDRPWFIAGFLWIIGMVMIWAGVTGDMEPNGWSIWIGRLIFLAFGVGIVGIAWHFFPFQRFVFDRASATFTHDLYRPFGRRTTDIPLKDIERAMLEKEWGESSWMERVVLVLPDRRYPLELGFVGTPRGPIVDTINQWLDGQG